MITRRPLLILEYIDRFLGFRHTLNEWRFLFQAHFELLRPYLLPTGQKSSFWCCPYNGLSLPAENDQCCTAFFTAVPEKFPCLGVKDIPPADMELWEFCPDAFSKDLSRELGLHATANHIHENILPLGELYFKSAKLPAFLLKQENSEYILWLQEAIGHQPGSCLFFTPRYCPDIAEWLSRQRHGYFPLEDLLLPNSLKPTPEYWQVLLEFKLSISGTEDPSQTQVSIGTGFRQIFFPDGYVIHLAKSHKRRAVVRFIWEQLQQTGQKEFYVELMRETYNSQFPEKPWNSDRIREDLFKRNLKDFDRLFETLDAPNGRYRLKI